MNELPELKDQAKAYLVAEPSPFVHFNEQTKKYLDGGEAVWKNVCKQKFDWVRRHI